MVDGSSVGSGGGGSHHHFRHKHSSSSLSAPPNQAQIMPQQPVEARSLSGITSIASNPPAYPRNPTQKKLDPLVLYIVRVPGSKGMHIHINFRFLLFEIRWVSGRYIC